MTIFGTGDKEKPAWALFREFVGPGGHLTSAVGKNIGGGKATKRAFSLATQ